MSRNPKFIVIAFLFILLIQKRGISASKFYLELSGGGTFGGTGKVGYRIDELYKGYNLNLLPLMSLSKDVLVGGQISYTRLYPTSNISTETYACLTKLVPMIRYVSAPEPNPEFFYQLGLGYYWLYQKFDFSDRSPHNDNKFHKNTAKDFGINLGIGFIIDKKFVIYPSGDFVFHKPKMAKYFKIDFGYLFSL